jgi:hypothetical protein
MARDDAKKVFEHLEKAKEASKPLGDPGLTKKIETAQEHIKKRVDPDQKSPKGIESLSTGSLSTNQSCTKAFDWMHGFSRPEEAPEYHYIHDNLALCKSDAATRHTYCEASTTCPKCIAMLKSYSWFKQ